MKSEVPIEKISPLSKTPELNENRLYFFENNGDQYGWNKNLNGTHNITLFIEGGRVKNTEQYKLKEALRKIADIHPGDFRLTGNQNLMICRIPEKEKPIINGIRPALRSSVAERPTPHQTVGGDQ